MNEGAFQIIRMSVNVLDKSRNPAALNPTYFYDNYNLLRPFLPNNGRVTFEGKIGVRWPVEEFGKFIVTSEVCEDYTMQPVEVFSTLIKGTEFIQDVPDKKEPHIIQHVYE